MSINPLCDKCKKELQTFGGILLGPPDENSDVKKHHLCVECYKEIVKELK